MIISHSHNFVLLSINKIATTSSHYLLSQFVGPDDVTTGYHDETDTEFIFDETSKPVNMPPVTYNEFYMNLEIPVPNWPKYIGGPLDQPNPELEALFRRFPPEAILNNIAQATIKHATPTELINWRLLNEHDLKKYDVYAFVRDPIQRALSSFFFEKFVHKTEATVESVVEWIDTMDPDWGPSIFLGKKYKNYFYYKGEQIAKPLSYSNYESEMRRIINQYGGTAPVVFPTFKSKCRPEWSKKPLENWLPQNSFNRLKFILREDIEFYNNI